jgi:hypothetical protein
VRVCNAPQKWWRYAFEAVRVNCRRRRMRTKHHKARSSEEDVQRMTSAQLRLRWTDTVDEVVKRKRLFCCDCRCRCYSIPLTHETLVNIQVH